VLAGFDDGVVRVWDEVSGKIVLSLAGHRFGVTDAQWSPDGARILTGSEDGTVRLWNATTGEMTGLFLCFLSDGGVAILDAPSLSLRSGPGEVWDYLGRPEILAGQLTRVGVERRQYINPDPLPETVAEPSPAIPEGEGPAAEGTFETSPAPEAVEAGEVTEAAEISESTEPADDSAEQPAEQDAAVSAGSISEPAPAQPDAAADRPASQAAPAGEDVPAQSAHEEAASAPVPRA